MFDWLDWPSFAISVVVAFATGLAVACLGGRFTRSWRHRRGQRKAWGREPALWPTCKHIPGRGAEVSRTEGYQPQPGRQPLTAGHQPKGDRKEKIIPPPPPRRRGS